MKLNKKFFTVVLFSFVIEISLFAQISLNSQDDFYKTVQEWQIRNVIKTVPPMRPYPLSVITEILLDVLENGSSKDRLIAQNYLDEINGKKWHFITEVQNTSKLTSIQNSEKEKTKIESELAIYPALNGELNLFEEYISFAYNAGFCLRTLDDEKDFLPFATFSNHDALFDAAKIGPLYGLMDMNDAFAFGKNGFYFQAGVFRNAFGPFLNEELALNSQSLHRPVIGFSYYNSKFAYSQSVSTIGATTNSGIESEVVGGKFLSFHEIEYSFTKWLRGTFYETAVFGGRFDPSYIIPTPFMLSQSFSGYSDSIMMGLNITAIPMSGLMIATDILVDDLSVNDLVKFNLDSKNRIAWKNGAKYAFGDFLLDSISLDYTLITPFTYSHWDFDNYSTFTMNSNTYNYQNYTNCGYTIGTNLPPNSDKISLSFSLTPITGMKVNIFTNFMRHANVLESFSDDEALEYLMNEKNVFSTDGSIFTHAHHYGDNGFFSTAVNHLNFLTQPHKMYVLQTGFDCDYSFNQIKFGKWSINFSYLFEFIHNYGVDTNLFEGGKVTFNEKNQTYEYDGKFSTNQNEVVVYYRNLWAQKLTNLYNNYFTISVKCQF